MCYACALHAKTLREEMKKKSCGKNLLPINSLLISERYAYHQLEVDFANTDVNVVCMLAKTLRKIQYLYSHVCRILQMQRLCSL